MAGERLGRILDVLNDGDLVDVLGRLCRACATEFGLSGAGLAVIIGGEHRGTLGVSDPQVARVEDLQFTVGEGPCLDAHENGRPVLEPNLATALRWPAFRPEAVAAGVLAVFSVPLRLGAARFGALDLYRDTPGPLGDGVLADARLVAEVATAAVVSAQAQAPPGTLPEVFEGMAERTASLHQAAGMVAVQLVVTLEEALVSLRARAYAEGRPVAVIAAEVIERRLRFER